MNLIDSVSWWNSDTEILSLDAGGDNWRREDAGNVIFGSGWYMGPL